MLTGRSGVGGCGDGGCGRSTGRYSGDDSREGWTKSDEAAGDALGDSDGDRLKWTGESSGEATGDGEDGAVETRVDEY